ncbi:MULTISPECIES: hypothetical protein [unclassified Streptococcus]|uniref:hypothetical protein n=1 Tax=unclassified Streptococcus TaxID=2608887 RepID=UPI0018AAA65F|nr:MULTISPECIES: hypothetical protein [unclassified Streptococcus]MBF8969581.1 hypothetical protein [Streptococcus sp. NLN76]MBJ6745100.1 hypothetical protein [Streptococcus sp. 121]
MSKKWLTVGLTLLVALGLTACSARSSQEQPVEEETVLAIPENLDGTYAASTEDENYHLTMKDGQGTLISDDGAGNKIVRQVQVVDPEGMMVDEEYMLYRVENHQLYIQDIEYDYDGELEAEKVFKRTG